MRTRNNGTRTLGAYTEDRLEDDQSFKTALKKFKAIINNLNFFMVKNLKKKRKTSPIHRLTIEINESFQKFLVSNYEMGLKYRICHDFLFDFKIETERFVNISSQSSCKFFVKPGSFMIKLNRKSRQRYISRGQIPKCLEKNPSITVKFISSYTSLSLSDEAFLSNYLNS